MLKISTKSQYGLRAMAYLASCDCKDCVCSIKEISENEGISFSYLEKILSKLEKGGLIKSKKGVCGGYKLAKLAGKIRVNEIIEALEGKTALVKCTDKSCRCSNEKKCLTKSVWVKLQNSLNKTLESITLKDLIK